eukprot:318446-Chlamydomonas_euryale.AAC.2
MSRGRPLTRTPVLARPRSPSANRHAAALQSLCTRRPAAHARRRAGVQFRANNSKASVRRCMAELQGGKVR